MSPALTIRKLRASRGLKQKGFTLIELLVALSILTVLALLAITAFDGSRSKAQAMIGMMKQVGDANIMLKTDTGCFVNNPQALFDETAAHDDANNFCGRDFTRSWVQPYLAPQPVDADGKIRVEKIGSEVVIGLPAAATSGSWKYYFVQAENVPEDILRQALVECNGTDDPPDTAFPAVRCRSASVTGGTFEMMYAQTR